MNQENTDGIQSLLRKKYETAEELWDSLSPTNELVAPPCKLIYRGQENAEWRLIPSILRDETRNIFSKNWSRKLYGDQIHMETTYIFFDAFRLELGLKFMEVTPWRRHWSQNCLPHQSINSRFEENRGCKTQGNRYTHRPKISLSK